MFLLSGEAVAEKKKDEKTDSEIPPLYFINLKLVIPGCNEAVSIQVIRSIFNSVDLKKTIAAFLYLKNKKQWKFGK